MLGAVEAESHAFLLREWKEIVDATLEEQRKVTARNLQLQVARLSLAEFQYLLQQTYQAVDVVGHYLVGVLVGGGLLLEILYRSRDDGKWSE